MPGEGTVRRRLRPIVAVLVVGLGFFAVNLILATGQWDRDRVTFRADPGIEVTLDGGDERIVYMTADASRGLSFDLYPSDFDCSGHGPDGALPVQPADHRRLLDVWQRYWSIGSVRAGTAGSYTIMCRGHGDTPLVLASPARFTVGWASPMFALSMLGAAALVGGVVRGTRFVTTMRRRSVDGRGP